MHVNQILLTSLPKEISLYIVVFLSSCIKTFQLYYRTAAQRQEAGATAAARTMAAAPAGCRRWSQAGISGAWRVSWCSMVRLWEARRCPQQHDIMKESDQGTPMPESPEAIISQSMTVLMVTGHASRRSMAAPDLPGGRWREIRLFWWEGALSPSVGRGEKYSGRLLVWEGRRQL